GTMPLLTNIASLPPDRSLTAAGKATKMRMLQKRISPGVAERTHFTVLVAARVSLRLIQERFSRRRRIGFAPRRIAATSLAQPEGSRWRAALCAFSECKVLLPNHSGGEPARC